jgi:S1-C subfamily serine protease
MMKNAILAALVVLGLSGVARAEESLLARLEREVRDLARKAGPAVVKVTGSTTSPFLGREVPEVLEALLSRSGTVGTGFLVSEDGLVVTTHRIARGAGKARVEFGNGEVRDGEVLGSDPFYQVAVVRVEPVEGVEPLPLSEEPDVEDGSIGVFVGHAFGTARSISLSVVSSAGRQAQALEYDNYLVTNAPVHPGDEGGPLVSATGHVVAMGAGRHTGTAVVQVGTSSGAFRLAGLTGSSGMGLLVPASDVKFALEEIEKHGRVRHAKLGIHLKPRSLTISEVRPDTPADKAGLLPGDRIVKLEGRVLATDSDLRFRLRRTCVEALVKLSVRRGEKEVTVETGLADITAPRTTEVLRGVLVRSDGEPVVAAVVGLSELRPGDRIVSANGQPVGSAADVVRVIALKADASPVHVVVLRSGKRLDLAVER